MPKTHLIFSGTGVLHEHGIQVICRRCNIADVAEYGEYIEDTYHEKILFPIDEKKYLRLFGKDFGRARQAYNAMIACERCLDNVCEKPDGKCTHNEARKAREK